MDKDKILKILQKIKKVKVLIVGDLMVDEFLYGKVSRISPEAPVPVLEFSSHVFLPGGAANTAVNVTSLGGQAVIVGCIGDDAAGENLNVELNNENVDCQQIIKDPNRRTTLKTRVIAHTQQVVRIDREDAVSISSQTEKDVWQNITSTLDDCQVMLISDYAKGSVTPGIIKNMVKASKEKNIPLLADTKTDDPELFKGIDYLKPNILEAEKLSGLKIFNQESLIKAGHLILEKIGAKGIIITRAEQGITIFTPGSEPVNIKAVATEVHDVTGAGDTVGAALAMAIGAGLSLEDASLLANLAAGVVVRKIGTAQASPEEIVRMIDEVDNSG